MIRVVRTYTAKPGKHRELIDSLVEFQSYAESQDVHVDIYVEPWGGGSQVHLHTDHETADAGMEWLKHIINNQRARETHERTELLVEGPIETQSLADIHDFLE